MRNHPIEIAVPLPEDHHDRLMEARHECRLRTYPKILHMAANNFANGDQPLGSFTLPGEEAAENILNSHFQGLILRIARRFSQSIAGLRIGLRKEAAKEKGRVLASIALQDDGDPDPWLDEPWTEKELAAIEAAEKEEGIPW